MKSSVPLLVACLACGGCALELKLPRQSPPLADMEEPLALVEEPGDETLRQGLPHGGFTGVHVGDARTSLDDVNGETEGVLVTSVVENSPGVAAVEDGSDVGSVHAYRPLSFALHNDNPEAITSPANRQS